MYTKVSSQADTLDDLGDTRLLTVIFACFPNAAFVCGFLRRDLLLGLFELLAFLDTRVAHAFWSVRCETLVGEDGSGQ